MYLPRLALKNALRKPGRSLLTASSVVVGVALTILAWAFLDGLDRSVIHGQIRSDTGHLRVFRQGYLAVEEKGELHELIDEAGAVESMLRVKRPELRLHPRLVFEAELSNGRQGLVAHGIGIRPESHFRDFTLPLEKRLETEDGAGLKPLWLGADLATAFKAEPGDTLTVLARTRPGSYTAEDFVVTGIVRSSNPAIDNLVFFVPLDEAQTLLDCEDAVSDIVGFLPDQDLSTAAASELRPALGERKLAVQTWQERAEPILRLNRMRRKIFGLVVGIILLISATGIANTVVMSCFERIHEIGTLRALGFQTERVVALLMIEAFTVGLAGSALGAGLGAWIVYMLRDGLDLSRFMASSNYAVSLSSILYFALDWRPVGFAFGIGLIVTVLAAIFPAVKFSRLSPMEAMRR